MTMTQDGCICPVPKARTKYIAVEVPKVVFVPPKEKTKIITIKEIIERPASDYESKYEQSKYESDSKYESSSSNSRGKELEDDGVSFD